MLFCIDFTVHILEWVIKQKLESTLLTDLVSADQYVICASHKQRGLYGRIGRAKSPKKNLFLQIYLVVVAKFWKLGSSIPPPQIENRGALPGHK